MTQEELNQIIDFINLRVTTHWLIDHEGVTSKSEHRLLHNLKLAENKLYNILIDKPKQKEKENEKKGN